MSAIDEFVKIVRDRVERAHDAHDEEKCEGCGMWTFNLVDKIPLCEECSGKRMTNHDGGEYAEELALDNRERARDMRGAK